MVKISWKRIVRLWNKPFQTHGYFCEDRSFLTSAKVRAGHKQKLRAGPVTEQVNNSPAAPSMNSYSQHPSTCQVSDYSTFKSQQELRKN